MKAEYRRFIRFCFILIAVFLSSSPAVGQELRAYVVVVGSSTAYPLVTAVAEQFARSTAFRSPKVESTGSGGGLKQFCAGSGPRTPDIVMTSRRMKASELEQCRANGAGAIAEIKIGYDGIAVVNAIGAAAFVLTAPELYLALAKQVPDPGGARLLVDNPYQTWRQIGDQLPDQPIRILGPPPTSGTRDRLAEVGMERGCAAFSVIRALPEAQRKSVCEAVREDGAYVESGENDRLMVRKLGDDPGAVGILGYNFLDRNRDRIQAASVDGVYPTFENIEAGRYLLTRPLFLYAKADHAAVVPGLVEFAAEFVAEATWGEEGYLIDKGLIPMSTEERERWRANAALTGPFCAFPLCPCLPGGCSERCCDSNVNAVDEAGYVPASVEPVFP